MSLWQYWQRFVAWFCQRIGLGCQEEEAERVSREFNLF